MHSPYLLNARLARSALGHERRFRAVRRVSAYPLTAAEYKQPPTAWGQGTKALRASLRQAEGAQRGSGTWGK
jgi:hypothetical protein